jgi:hypothetical protein
LRLASRVIQVSGYTDIDLPIFEGVKHRLRFFFRNAARQDQPYHQETGYDQEDDCSHSG